jgi:alpha-1,2-mannosyltransferase
MDTLTGEPTQRTRIRRGGWLPLAAALFLFLLVVAGYGVLVSTSPSYWQQTDLTVFRAGGLAVRSHPAQLYALPLGVARQPFIYSPFAGLLFALASPFSFLVWKIAITAATIALLPVIAYAALGLAGRPAGVPRLAGALAIGALGLCLEPVLITLYFGQVNVLLLALVVCDLALPDRFRGKGIGVGLAAAIKLTPLIFIPYLLFTRRIRAAVVSVLTVGVTAVIGFVLLPRASATFWSGHFKAFGHAHLLNQSLYGAALRLTHGAPLGDAYWLAAIVVGIAGLATAVVASRRGYQLVGAVVCGGTGLLVSPTSFSHHWVYVLPALALAAYGPPRRSLRIAGVALVMVLFAAWPVPLGGDGGIDLANGWLPRGLLRLAPHYGTVGPVNHELHWHGLWVIFGNYYVITALAFIAAVACYLAAHRPGVRAASQAPLPAGSGDHLAPAQRS